MADDTLTLSGNFPEASETDWLDGVSRALKGASADRLNRLTDDGLTLKALYREADWPSAENRLGAPGAAPFLRGAKSVRDTHLPWDIRQSFAHPDPALTNGEILRDLERGVSSIALQIDPTGARGCAIVRQADLETALSGVDLSIAAVALDVAGSEAGFNLDAATFLHALAGPEAKLDFNLDPLGALARFGQLAGGLDAAFQETANRLTSFAEERPQAGWLRADGRPAHEAGASEAEELACLIASAIDTLRRLEACGLSAELAAPRLLFTLALDANYGIGVAKLRAARRLWARCLEALRLDPHPMRLQAVTSARMLTRYDPWVNLLRNTAACFAGGVGGADIITVRPFTDALGLAGELGRRTARNTQIIAMEEAALGKVADPTGGAWFTEQLGDELAEAAWAAFQAIESEGGYGASLMADGVQARIAETRAARMKAIAKGKRPLTGVSSFPILGEIPAPVADIVRSEASDVSADQDVDAEGADFASPLWPISLAEPFERLRDHAEVRTAASGKRPTIFLATLGPLAEHNARADYARNLFAAGGIEALGAPEPPGDLAGLVAAFKASGCALAVLCGGDARYEAEAQDAARALKAAGVQRLYLAGRPGENEAAWRAAGIESFVHIGIDMVAALELAHAELGIAT